jgi:hypothetical protein
MANVTKLLLPLRVYADNKRFPKNSWFFHNSTANYVLCFLIITLILEMYWKYCGLHFQFRQAHYHS